MLLAVTLIHMLLDCHSDPIQQQYMFSQKLPLLTSPASSPAALHHNLCSINSKLPCCFSECIMLFLSSMPAILLCVECSLPSLSGKCLFIFQKQLKHNFLPETFPDVYQTSQYLKNYIYIVISIILHFN